MDGELPQVPSASWLGTPSTQSTTQSTQSTPRANKVRTHTMDATTPSNPALPRYPPDIWILECQTKDTVLSSSL